MESRKSSRLTALASGAGSEYLSAAEAAQLLHVKPQTLYTYVSRGLIRSVAQPDQKRRLYNREDVEKVHARSEIHHRRGATAASVLRWDGDPVINTSITEVTPEGPRYRGRLAPDLARDGCSFEAASELLWTGVLQHEPVHWDHELLPEGLPRLMDSVALQHPQPSMLRIFALATSMLGVAETAHRTIRHGATISVARQLLLALAGCLGYLARRPGFRTPDPGSSIAESIAAMFELQAGTDASSAINQALVLCADDDMSLSTFSARVAASTGAKLRTCVLAAIAAQSGATLGEGCDRAEDLLRGARTRHDVRKRLAATEEAGAHVPGFNAPVYPEGDPRATQLLQLAFSFAPQNARAQLIHAFIEEAEQRLHLRPSVEVGLIALAAALRLPERSASALWALGRTAGWIAHIMEQRGRGSVLRPHARYIGAN